MNYYKGCVVGLILLLSLITANKAETQDRNINQSYQVLAMLDAYAQELPATDIEQKELEEMKGILSIKQLAEYALFRESFDHHINRLISKCKK